jgi:hypothetical protein
MVYNKGTKKAVHSTEWLPKIRYILKKIVAAFGRVGDYFFVPFFLSM